MLTRVLIVLALAAVVVCPFLLRPERSVLRGADATLVIITPHNEALRHEFGAGFQRWYEAKTGKRVALDWRVVGGTSEITRYLEGEYVAAFQYHWTRTLGRVWSSEVQAGFQNPRLGAAASAEAREAREEFLRSEVSCGIDLFFGGGPYDFNKQAEAGRIVPSKIFETHPEWFTESVLPQTWAGEDYWDKQHRWVGTVLSSYGILTNNDGRERLGVAPLRTWMDLGQPALVGELALADPTKSSSIAKAFENLVQQQMQIALRAARRARPEAAEAELEKEAVRQGWTEAMRLLQRMGGNARYFSDSSQKPPIDVAAGNSSFGVCIDFYGRQQAEAVSRREGGGRLNFLTPEGGTVSSVDPIAILRGAPQRELAEAFVEYVLSLDGQKLWNFRPGTPGGPEQYALRRIPVRRDFFTQAEWRQYCSDPEAEPYAEGEKLSYRPAWSAHLFREMAFIIRVMCLDTHPELTRAWRAMVEAGMPREALVLFSDVSRVSYDEAGGRIKKALAAKSKVEEIELAKELGNHFRRQYLRAEAVAKGQSAPP